MFCLLIPVMNVTAQNNVPPPSLDEAIEQANTALDQPHDPYAYRESLKILNNVTQQDDETTSKKMQAYQALLDSAVDSVQRGLDVYPVEYDYMKAEINLYKQMFTSTNLPEFNEFAKSQWVTVEKSLLNAQVLEQGTKKEETNTPAQEEPLRISNQVTIAQWGILVGMFLVVAFFVGWKRKNK